MRWRFLGEAYRGSGIWINDRGRRRLRDFQVRSVSFGTRSNRHSMRVRRARVAWASAKAFAIPELSSTPYWSVRCFANRRLHRALDRFPDSFQPLDRVGDPAPQLLRSLIQVEGPPAGRSPRGSLGISGHFRLQGAIPVHDAGRQPVASASASRRLCGHRLGRPPPRPKGRWRPARRRIARSSCPFNSFLRIRASPIATIRCNCSTSPSPRGWRPEMPPDRAAQTSWPCRPLESCNPPAQPVHRAFFCRRSRCGSKTGLERYGPVDAISRARPMCQRESLPSDPGLRFVGLVKAWPTIVSTRLRRQSWGARLKWHWWLCQDQNRLPAKWSRRRLKNQVLRD